MEMVEIFRSRKLWLAALTISRIVVIFGIFCFGFYVIQMNKNSENQDLVRALVGLSAIAIGTLLLMSVYLCQVVHEILARIEKIEKLFVKTDSEK